MKMLPAPSPESLRHGPEPSQVPAPGCTFWLWWAYTGEEFIRATKEDFGVTTPVKCIGYALGDAPRPR